MNIQNNIYSYKELWYCVVYLAAYDPYTTKRMREISMRDRFGTH